MKYILYPDHLAYTIAFGRVEEARVIKCISNNKFLIKVCSSDVAIEVVYGKDIFLTYKKARKELDILIMKFENRKTSTNQIINPSFSKFTICEMWFSFNF